MANVALLATVADSKASQQAGGASALMPSGVILPFAGSTSPMGWIVCDGTAYSQADYPELFAVLGSSYNTQVNPTTGSAWAAPSAGQFRVPDMRGLFLRGEGTASGGDAVSVGGHQGGKTAKNGLGNGTGTASGNAGGVSADHAHYIAAAMNVGESWLGWLVNDGEPNRNHAMAMRDAGAGNGANANHVHGISVGTTAQTITGDNETRPTNRGVKYIIKA